MLLEDHGATIDSRIALHVWTAKVYISAKPNRGWERKGLPDFVPRIPFINRAEIGSCRKRREIRTHFWGELWANLSACALGGSSLMVTGPFSHSPTALSFEDFGFCAGAGNVESRAQSWRSTEVLPKKCFKTKVSKTECSALTRPN